MSTLTPAFARRLASRKPLRIDPLRGFAVKRNTHEWILEADPDGFAAALTDLLAQPGAQFGRLRVKRMPGRVGKPFEIGERFTGSLSGWWPEWLADSLLSDFAEIVEVSARRVVYRYLSGCPMAGTSTFLVEDHARGCRFRVIFEYQEVSGLAITILNRFGLRMHDEVTRLEVERAAAAIGARIVASTLQGPTGGSGIAPQVVPDASTSASK
jgi:hypothetical protein